MTSQSRNPGNRVKSEEGEEEMYSKALYTSYVFQHFSKEKAGRATVTGRSSDTSLTEKKPIFSTDLHISLENPHSIFHSQLKESKYVRKKSVLFIQPIKNNPYK